MYNDHLKIKDSDKFKAEFNKLNALPPEILGKKIPESLIQSAAMLRLIYDNIKKDSKILCVGSLEDMPLEVLIRDNYNVEGVDPVLNTSIEGFIKANPDKCFDIVFSTSVIEHVGNDVQFVKNMYDILTPGGIGILTCDFKPTYSDGNKLPWSCKRLYTADRLSMLAEIIKNLGGSLVTKPTWKTISNNDLDFSWDGVKYCFVSMSFKKGK